MNPIQKLLREQKEEFEKIHVEFLDEEQNFDELHDKLGDYIWNECYKPLVIDWHTTAQ